MMVIFYYVFKHKKTNTRIGIYSEGDLRESIEDALQTFKTLDSSIGNIYILVLACRTYDGTVDRINEMGNVQTLYFIGKSKTNDNKNIE
ncbi:hypothetical protein [Vagococcus hydrophili]|uniref:Uncharacterized protein n=1 Tax=Vagococcus hydrophili TaxID=2714947 RepID=A0A6G8ATU4_9ENTE|nr:hypothetical protein [Vagococcus hydrophili]QIL48498.1 hypothetical protein G7082_08295 [Vagococcus hydrophili]